MRQSTGVPTNQVLVHDRGGGNEGGNERSCVVGIWLLGGGKEGRFVIMVLGLGKEGRGGD